MISARSKAFLLYNLQVFVSREGLGPREDEVWLSYKNAAIFPLVRIISNTSNFLHASIFPLVP